MIEESSYSTSSNLDNTVSTNIDFINQQMDQIQGKITSILDSNQKNSHIILSDNDNNILFEKINAISQAYYNCEREFLEKLQNEVKSNVAVGNSYIQLDQELKEEAMNNG